MTRKDKLLMEKYDITSTSNTVYFYKDFQYETLDRAVTFAKHEARKLRPTLAHAVSQ